MGAHAYSDRAVAFSSLPACERNERSNKFEKIQHAASVQRSILPAPAEAWQRPPGPAPAPKHVGRVCFYLSLLIM